MRRKLGVFKRQFFRCLHDILRRRHLWISFAWPVTACLLAAPAFNFRGDQIPANPLAYAMVGHKPCSTQQKSSCCSILLGGGFATYPTQSYLPSCKPPAQGFKWTVSSLREVMVRNNPSPQYKLFNSQGTCGPQFHVTVESDMRLRHRDVLRRMFDHIFFPFWSRYTQYISGCNAMEPFDRLLQE